MSLKIGDVFEEAGHTYKVIGTSKYGVVSEMVTSKAKAEKPAEVEPAVEQTEETPKKRRSRK